MDLLPVMKRCAVFLTGAAGLKTLAHFIGLEWRDEDSGGSEDKVCWAEYMDDPVGEAATRDRVIAYSGGKVRATLARATGYKTTPAYGKRREVFGLPPPGVLRIGGVYPATQSRPVRFERRTVRVFTTRTPVPSGLM
ncbi:MAG: hypothetical protein AB2L07_16005 [Thermoanaerobaculaceae bacterium]